MEDLGQVKKLVNMYNLDDRFQDYPAISAQVMEEDKEQFGCTAGGTDRFYINAKGDLQPCEFLNISFGNIGSDDFEKIYQKMRRTFETPGNYWLCERYAEKILELFEEHNLKTLPLSCDLSKNIYGVWNRGDHTELYKKIEEIK